MSARLGFLAAAAALIWGIGSAMPAGAQVSNTRHNLSVSGPGTVKATSEQELCIFCHAPHSRSPLTPLWNRNVSGSTYTTYSSSTTRARDRSADRLLAALPELP